MPKYHHPKILLIDLKDQPETVLKAEGYNVTVGSFGVPYKVPKGDKVSPVISNGFLPPDLTEREIVVIDLVPTHILGQPIGEKHTSPGESDWWASCSEGLIDPRPRLMTSVKNAFDRIFEHGGIFIIFAASRNTPRVIQGYQSYSGIEKEEDIYCHNLGWKHHHIQALFYQSGRIEPIPQHYEFIGVVERFWEKLGVVGVRIEASMLMRGDRIAFELPVEFAEQDVESLQVDKNPVSQAELGRLAGLQTSLPKGQFKKGTRVFRLMQS